ncbi:MAG: radical SAM protein [Candidatus Omnitrophica bacterium]|nr:radical SAM protein [Candidatus Omnitrophota bacterium]MDD5574982.1 radical SAM protein [Candidatus Omnitrophota bacterium]
MKYVYGPVKSRRLGFSLGVSTVPYKVCSFDCVYCQLKETTRKTLTRKTYLKTSEILEELRTFFTHRPKDVRLDYVTFSGAGEPTLHRGIGRILKAVRRMSPVPVVVITNASTLMQERVRRDLLDADIVIPSLDAVTQDVFEKIDRPVGNMRIEDVIEGLKQFRRVYGGKMWLEIMLVRGINDSVPYLELLKKTADEIGPDRVQINAPVRPPALPWVKVPTKSTLSAAKKIFGKKCDVVC